MTEPVAKDSPPRILGRYAVYEAIASGAMATVHYGRLLGPVGFSRTVAIKRLLPQFAQDPEFVTMFLDEARMAARIRHPNVVATLDVVAESNEIFLVMDYVHGESLGQILRVMNKRGERMPPSIVLRIATDALQGLHAAHEATDEHGVPLNLVHRDISPHNILLGVDGVARLVDFGVAKATGRASATRDGHIKGKLAYMSPEQLRARPVTRQADIHAFGIVLWEMLAGKRLFVADTETALVAAVTRHAIPPLSGLVADLPPALDVIVRRGTAVKVENRFATALEMSIALEKCGPIAPTREVADWVQSQTREALDERSKVVGAIERDRSAESGGVSKESSTGSAKAWVARLSNVPPAPEPNPASGAAEPKAPPDAGEPGAPPAAADAAAPTAPTAPTAPAAPTEPTAPAAPTEPTAPAPPMAMATSAAPLEPGAALSPATAKAPAPASEAPVTEASSVEATGASLPPEAAVPLHGTPALGPERVPSLPAETAPKPVEAVTAGARPAAPRPKAPVAPSKPASIPAKLNPGLPGPPPTAKNAAVAVAHPADPGPPLPAASAEAAITVASAAVQAPAAPEPATGVAPQVTMGEPVLMPPPAANPDAPAPPVADGPQPDIAPPPPLGDAKPAVASLWPEAAPPADARPPLDSVSAEDVVGLPRAPPRAAVWAAAVACVALIVGTALAFKARSGSSSPSASPSTSPSAIASTEPSPAPSPTAMPTSETPPAPTESATALELPANVAPSATATATPKSLAITPRPSPGRKSTRPSCNPPYTIDKTGVRVPKRECFK